MDFGGSALVDGEVGEFVEEFGGGALGEGLALGEALAADLGAAGAAFGRSEEGVGFLEGEVEGFQDGGEVGFGGEGFEEEVDVGGGGGGGGHGGDSWGRFLVIELIG